MQHFICNQGNHSLLSTVLRCFWPYCTAANQATLEVLFFGWIQVPLWQCHTLWSRTQNRTIFCCVALWESCSVCSPPLHWGELSLEVEGGPSPHPPPPAVPLASQQLCSLCWRWWHKAAPQINWELFLFQTFTGMEINTGNRRQRVRF